MRHGMLLAMMLLAAGLPALTAEEEKSGTRDRHEWIDLSVGYLGGWHYGGDDSLGRLWNQLMPGSINWGAAATQVAMGADIEAKLRPASWCEVGPMVVWNYWAPGAAGSLTWESDGHGYNTGVGFTRYPAGHMNTRHQITMANVVYGGRLVGQWPVPSDDRESGRIWVSVAAGWMQLVGASYRVWSEGDLRQEVDFSGSAPYYELGLGGDYHTGPRSGITLGLRWQQAYMDHFTARTARDDYAPEQTGHEQTAIDLNTGAPITVNFGSLVADLALYFMF